MHVVLNKTRTLRAFWRHKTSILVRNTIWNVAGYFCNAGCFKSVEITCRSVATPAIAAAAIAFNWRRC